MRASGRAILNLCQSTPPNPCYFPRRYQPEKEAWVFSQTPYNVKMDWEEQKSCSEIFLNPDMPTLITHPTPLLQKSAKFPDRMAGLHYKDSFSLMYGEQRFPRHHIQSTNVSRECWWWEVAALCGRGTLDLAALSENSVGGHPLVSSTAMGELGWVLLTGSGERESKSLLAS